MEMQYRFKFYLDTRRKLESNMFPIKVNLYDKKDKKQLIFKIPNVDGIEISASKKDWVDLWVNRHKKNNFDEVTGENPVYGHKKTIRTILKAKEDILNELLVTEGIHSLEAIKEAFNNYTIPTKFTDNVYEEFIKKISELEQKEPEAPPPAQGPRASRSQGTSPSTRPRDAPGSGRPSASGPADDRQLPPAAGPCRCRSMGWWGGGVQGGPPVAGAARAP